MISYLRQKPILILPILLVIVLLFFYLKNSREKATEDRAVRYCADIAYIKYANDNPNLFINFDFSKVIEAAKKREIELKKEPVEAKVKRENVRKEELKRLEDKKLSKDIFIDPTLVYPINIDLFMNASVAGKSNEYSDIISINNNTIDYKTEHKISSFRNYEKFYKNCTENFILIKNDKDAKNKFIETYKVRPKQDVSKLLQLDKERFIKLANLLKGFSETEYLVKRLVFMHKLDID
jgi:hypothetical protein